MCQEDSTQCIKEFSFYFSLCPVNSWNVPACGYTAILSVPGVQGISVGAYLWNDAFGYFKINSVDVSGGTVGIVNTCTSGNADPGTQIPACTCFILTDIPAADSNLGCDFLAVDFTAPAESDCIDITLTSVNGLIAGNNVQIGSAVYSLSEIKANNIVTICNEGQGFPQGTAVIAKDITGQYQYCIILLTVNPCGEDPVTTGPVTVCSDGVQRVLTGDSTGMVVTLTNITTGEAHYAALPAPPDLDNDSGNNISVPSSGTINPAGTDNLTNAAGTLTITNASATESMVALFVCDGYCVGASSTSAGGQLQFDLNVDLNGGGANIVRSSTARIAGFDSQDATVTYFISAIIAPGATYNVQASLTVTTLGPVFAISKLLSQVSAIGVAV